LTTAGPAEATKPLPQMGLTTVALLFSPLSRHPPWAGSCSECAPGRGKEFRGCRGHLRYATITFIAACYAVPVGAPDRLDRPIAAASLPAAGA